MPVNVALGHLSNAFMIATLIIYSLSVFAFAGDFAFGRPRRAAAVRGQQEARDREAALATVGAAPGIPGTSGSAAAGTAAPEASGGPGDPGVPAASGGGGAAGFKPEPAASAIHALPAAGPWVVPRVRR